MQDTLTALCIVEGGGEALWDGKNGEGNGRLGRGLKLFSSVSEKF